MRALIVAAPASGSGKTLATLGLLAAFRRRGLAVAAAKTGPDYIDAAYLAAASGQPCLNLDPWAMRPSMMRALAGEAACGADLLLVEGVMGLFDGAADGRGATADLAVALDLPVLLVLDARGTGASLAATARGFRDHRRDVRVVAALANRVASPRHGAILDAAFSGLGLALLGRLPPRDDLVLKSRHLGLVQARERTDLDALLDQAADWVERDVDLDALLALAAPLPAAGRHPTRIAPPGQRVAIASDDAFAFAYPHVLGGWRAAGAELSFFSPLADEEPAPDADAIYLPGGYPELHAGRLAASSRWLAALRMAASRGLPIYGECGGFMVLGAAIVDRTGARHEMADLLPVVTSFAKPRLHLGYRRIETRIALPLAPRGAALRGHEFHYATLATPIDAMRAPFEASDALGASLGPVGAASGSVFGSFLHLIDLDDQV